MSLGSCAVAPKPPLARLYSNGAHPADQPPLVLIPGAFGSRLTRRSSGEEIWPRSNTSLLFSSYPNVGVAFDPDTLEPIADDVVATAVFRQGLGRDFYGAVLDTLEQIGGYKRLYPGQTPEPGQRAFYAYVYDWRLDNVAAVKGLHELLEQIALDWGDPQLKVDVLAHSNGGLMARYYARYGTADVLTDQPEPPRWTGAHRIRRLLMIGTPNLGSMQPVLSHLRGEEIGLRRIPADIVATCPGAPQLMPHPQTNSLVDLYGDPLALDLYAIDMWRELGWSIFRPSVRARVSRRLGSKKQAAVYLDALEAFLSKHLQRARRFHERMSIPARPDEPVPYVFGGDCTPTVARLVVERRNKGAWGHERVDTIAHPVAGVDYEALIHEPGDGVVSRNSLLGRHRPASDDVPKAMQTKQTVFLCESHQQLTGNASFQDNLLYNLLAVSDT